MLFDFSDPISGQDEKARQKKGFRYLSHTPEDEGQDPARQIGQSNWVLSYADMMTSLVVFLVLLLAFSRISDEKLDRISQSMTGKKEETRQGQVGENLQEIESKLEKSSLAEGVSLVKEPEGASLVIKDSVLFGSGEAALLPEAKGRLLPAFETLKTLSPDYRFIIEGHTDDNPIHTFEYASNWELSAARALAVLLLMREIGFEADRLSFHAFGEYQPVAPNRDSENNPNPSNQALNRRAVIKIRRASDIAGS